LTAQLAANPEPRCACVMVLDVSRSMSGARVAALNQGLAAFADSIRSDALVQKRVEVAVVTFGGVATLAQDFISAKDFQPPELKATGDTPLGAALDLAMDVIDARKAAYRDNGVPYFRPWLFLITDGRATDQWERPALRVKGSADDAGVTFYAVGSHQADMEMLRRIGGTDAKQLKGLRFVELFQWLSESQGLVSTSTDADAAPLPNTDGWAGP